MARSKRKGKLSQAKLCWCGKCHPGMKHFVLNWKLYQLRTDRVEKT